MPIYQISQLPTITQAPANDDVLAIEINGITYKVSKQVLAAAIATNITPSITPASIGAFGQQSLSTTPTDANNTSLYGSVLLQGSSCANLPTSTQGHFYEVAFMGTFQTAVLHSGTDGISRAYARYYANSQWYPWVRIDGIGKATLADVILASGTYTFSSLAAGTQTSAPIAFSASIGTTNYIVFTQPNVSRCAIGVQSKTASGFELFCRNVSAETSSPIVNWAVIALG